MIRFNMHGGAIMTGLSTKMSITTAISVMAILATTVIATGAIITEVTVFGIVGAGIVTVVGWGFGFLIESIEKKS